MNREGNNYVQFKISQNMNRALNIFLENTTVLFIKNIFKFLSIKVIATKKFLWLLKII